MKFLTSVSFFIMFIFTSNAWAVEAIEEQQVLLYYQIPFGGVEKVDNTHKFGFRIDRVSIDKTTGQYSNSLSFNDLIKKPASLDFQMGHSGVTAFKMHGYDYLPHLMNQADENGEASDTGKSEDEQFLKLPELNQTSFGLLLGIGIGVLAITL